MTDNWYLGLFLVCAFVLVVGQWVDAGFFWPFVGIVGGLYLAAVFLTRIPPHRPRR